MDNKGHFGKQMLGFYFLGMLFIAANFLLMGLGVYASGVHPW